MRNMSLKRKDCGGDTSTAMETCRRKDCGGDPTTDTKTSKVMEMKKKRAYRRKKYLPHDLIMQQILTKLPVPALLKSVLVSKLWYNSIHIDRKRFTHSHFLQSKKHPRVIFSLLDVRDGDTENTGEAVYGCHFFKFTNGLYGTENPLKFDMFRVYHTHSGISELVGYCNGLPCMAIVGDYSTGYLVSDPNRKDYLYIFYPAGVGKHISESRIICHGFGFDPSANEYKVVSVFCTPQKELNFVVFTLGTKSWRDVTATTMPISGDGGRSITKIRAPTGSDKSAIFCTSSSSNSGCLVWKVIVTLEGSDDSYAPNSNEKEMLMSFNLHDEKFQFIQLPAKSTTDEHQKHLLVDYPHLVEFKGFPCIARIEKLSGNGNDYPHRCRDDHKDSSSCCCCCKVHLYMLKDKVEQAWVKEESFDVRVNSSSKLAPDPCCFCLGSTTTPPTRIFGFSDQILLYWFNGKYLQVYNLCSEKFQLVLTTDREERDIFRAKMKEPRSDGDDDIYCSNMDYQLHCHEENFLSLETFIPDGVTGIDASEFFKLDLEKFDSPCSAYAVIYRGSAVFYPF
ncbi:uncharacterized protein LOC113322392 isoform X1 [Papaver somniferum]|uniref:uncharacterized protein LOC113322392 isoform X1 n=1 Tax=Papaver somniferum TaxID=3469 RepID=UPI000E6F7FEB|nr:uncharacterized protein LOC113322392 isoform X1 [Papaver somniferum]XP_026426252.1 uncharacterized protein LOC113322392 isoform X1 [Papaver somniferum]XP_026426254.1 uncharacterized protein LOC113322392 isoform X1 [Papaver somniferum]XP_026426255.1 uncharacterized protein LOC113322392 isoform X1 [Papaver somniferum]